MQLRSYQLEALQSIRESLEKGISRQLVVSPTGSGKSLIFSHIPQYVPGKMLVLAHREELLEQAKATIEFVNPDLIVEIEQAERHASTEADVVVASVPTLGRESSDRINKFHPKHFATVCVDEAHHTVGKTYGNILDHFKPNLRIGFTATPQRGDNIRLLDYFDEIVFFRTITEMIQEGYLVDLVGYRVSTNVDISSVGFTGGDYAVGELAKAVNIEIRNSKAVEAYQKLAPDSKALVFCVNVEHAYEMAREFRKNGIQAMALDGTSDPEHRRLVVDDFKNGSLQVLCNVNLFTEGTDIPSIGCIIFARPTRSPVMYSQAVGRGMRLFENKEYCIVIDLCDVTSDKKPIGLPTLMGLPPDFDPEGEPLLRAKEKFEELAEISPELAARARSMSQIQDLFEQVDLFRPPPMNEMIQQYTRFIWMETTNDTFVLNLGAKERLKIQGDTLGKYKVWLDHKDGEKYELTESKGSCGSLEEAFRRTDKWVKIFRAEHLALLDNEAAWRSDSPTDKQIKFLQRKGIPVLSDLTKGEASQMITKIIEDNPRPARPDWVERKIARRSSRGGF